MKPGHWLGLTLLSAQLSFGQALRPARTVGYTGRVDYDSYFGFYPTLGVSLPVDSLRDLSAYATYYTNPDFFGLETGIGFRVASARRAWSLTPTVGLLSGSVFVTGRPFMPAEGFVGSLDLQRTGSSGFVQVLGSYYGAWKRLTPETYDFLFASVRVGRNLTPGCRLSVVYERLASVRLPRNRTDATEFNVPRLGLAADVTLPRGFSAQALGGWTRFGTQRLFFRGGLSWSFPP